MRTIVILSLLLLTAGIAVAQKINDPFEGISTQLTNHCDSLLDRGTALFVIELSLPNDEEFGINSERSLLNDAYNEASSCESTCRHLYDLFLINRVSKEKAIQRFSGRRIFELTDAMSFDGIMLNLRWVQVIKVSEATEKEILALERELEAFKQLILRLRLRLLYQQ